MESNIKKPRARKKVAKKLAPSNNEIVVTKNIESQFEVLDVYPENSSKAKVGRFFESEKQGIGNYKKRSLLMFLPWVLLILFFSASVYFWLHPLVISKNTSGTLDKSEVAVLVKKVGKIILLPSSEVPEVTIVNDLKGLNVNPFFNNAKIGDDVMIYFKEKKAILYRPSTNMVIEVATVEESIPNKDPVM